MYSTCTCMLALTVRACWWDITTTVIEGMTQWVTKACGTTTRHSTASYTACSVAGTLTLSNCTRAGHSSSIVWRTSTRIERTVGKVSLVSGTDSRGEIRTEIAWAIMGQSKCLWNWWIRNKTWIFCHKVHVHVQIKQSLIHTCKLMYYVSFHIYMYMYMYVHIVLVFL